MTNINYYIPQQVTPTEFFSTLFGADPFYKYAFVKHTNPNIGIYFTKTPEEIQTGKFTWNGANMTFNGKSYDIVSNFFYRSLIIKISENDIDIITPGFDIPIPSIIINRIKNVIYQYLTKHNKTLSDCIFPNSMQNYQLTDLMISRDWGIVVVGQIRLYTGEKFRKQVYQPKQCFQYLEPITFLTGVENYNRLF